MNALDSLDVSVPKIQSSVLVWDMLVLLDIGSTLVDCDLPSPARRLLAESNFSEAIRMCDCALKLMSHCVYTKNRQEPSALADVILSRFALRFPDQNILQHRRSFTDLLVHVWNEQKECAVEVPGARKFLDTLSKRKITVCLVSNLWYPFWVAYCELYPQYQNLPRALSYEIGEYKPSKLLYERAFHIANDERVACFPSLSKFKCPTTYMIGDKYSKDIAPAMELGYDTLWFVRNKNETFTQVCENVLPRPTHVFFGMDEICSFFDEPRLSGKDFSEKSLDEDLKRYF